MFLCMKTTMDIDDELLRLARRRAADEGSTLKAVVESALSSYLSKPTLAPRYRLQWRTESGTLPPRVNLNDRDSLFDRMGER